MHEGSPAQFRCIGKGVCRISFFSIYLFLGNRDRIRGTFVFSRARFLHIFRDLAVSRKRFALLPRPPSLFTFFRCRLPRVSSIVTRYASPTPRILLLPRVSLQLTKSPSRPLLLVTVNSRPIAPLIPFVSLLFIARCINISLILRNMAPSLRLFSPLSYHAAARGLSFSVPLSRSPLHLLSLSYSVSFPSRSIITSYCPEQIALRLRAKCARPCWPPNFNEICSHGPRLEHEYLRRSFAFRRRFINAPIRKPDSLFTASKLYRARPRPWNYFYTMVAPGFFQRRTPASALAGSQISNSRFLHSVAAGLLGIDNCWRRRGLMQRGILINVSCAL